MNTEVRCGSCGALIPASNVDTQRELATCGQCGRLMDLRRTGGDPAPARGPATAERARPPIQLPEGMSLTTTGTNLVIRRRWLRAKHWLLLALFTTAGAGVAYWWSTAGASVWLVIGTLFVVSWNFNLAGMFFNSTVVTADAAGVTVNHGPLPSLFARNASVQRQDIDQLYAGAHGARFAVLARLKSGRDQRLIAPLISPEQALFVEQQLERILGLADFPIPDELSWDGKSPAGAKAGAALVLLIPAFIAAILALFFVVSHTEVSGRLQAKAALGSWAFAANDCSSGQRESFDGVVLTATGDPHAVRVVRDPVRGSLLVIASAGQPNRVIAQDSCSRFQVNVNRTNTNINDIWVVDGNLSVECEQLAGSVVFEGCH
jgi:hypothetical protein